MRITILALIPLGFWMKYGAPGGPDGWCSRYGAGVLYEMFWVLAAGLVFRRASVVRCGAWVFLVTCALEFLQLWHPPWLESIRGTILGAALIGRTFDPLDFPHYVLGCGVGVLLLAILRRTADRPVVTAR